MNVKEMLRTIASKATEHKTVLLTVGATLVGALVGGLVSVILSRNEEEMLIDDENTLDLEEGEEEEELGDED